MNSQYLYINSENRLATDKSCKFTVKVPNNYLKCKDLSQVIKITCINFCCPINWYFVNSTNNTFILNDGIDNSLSIPPGNYTFKNLALAIQTQIQTINPLITVSFNSNTTKLLFTFPSASFSLKFGSSGSACFIMGFNPSSTNFADGSFQITSINILQTILTDTINLYVDNVATYGNPNMCNNSLGDNTLYISNSIMSLQNNFSPGDIINFTNSGDDLFSMKIKDKSLNEITFSIRDRDGDLMTYVTDWNAAIRIDYIDEEKNNDDVVGALNNMIEYLRLLFVQNGLK